MHFYSLPFCQINTFWNGSLSLGSVQKGFEHLPFNFEVEHISIASRALGNLLL